MSRPLAAPTSSTPYLATWTAASDDFTATTAAVAPVILGSGFGNCWLRTVFTGDVAGSFVARLALHTPETRWGTAQVLWQLRKGYSVSSTAAVMRRTANANDAGQYFAEHDPDDGAHWDLHGLDCPQGHVWSLAIASMTTVARIDLVSFKNFDRLT